MRRPVLLAVPQAWETVVVESVSASAGLELVRRCADLAELLSAAAAGLGEFALVGAGLTGVDRTAVATLEAAGVRVIGVVRPDDEAEERSLRRLGLETVLPADAGPDRLAEALLSDSPASHAEELQTLFDGPTAEMGVPTQNGRPLHADIVTPTTESASLGWRPRDRADHLSGAALDVGAPGPAVRKHDEAADRRPGLVVAVWGPAGAPGRSSVALALTSEAARMGVEALLIDADPYGGAQAQALALLDEAPGLAGAVRSADQGALDAPGLAARCLTVAPGLSVLTGLPRADRWPELRADPMVTVLELTKLIADLVVVDCGFCLEDDEELSYDTAAPRRNAATLTALANADHVVVVGAGEPVGLQRLVRGLQDLGTVRTPAARTVVINRVRVSAVGPRPQESIAATLERFVGLTGVRFVPDDRPAFDRAALQGRTLAECARESPARLALAELTAHVLGRELDAVAARSVARSTKRIGRRRSGRSGR